jgi:hypothetical protein
MLINKAVAVFLAATSCAGAAQAHGGPLGIDRRLSVDDDGVWERSNQKMMMRVFIGGTIAGALWEGSDTRLGKTFYQAIDATVVGEVAAEVLKRTFRRLRPSQTDDPNRWFTDSGRSFPSGEVTSAAALITPFVLEYAHEHPSLYALELIPLYDAQARMKVRGHWQTDVLAGWALGTAAGYYAHGRNASLVVGILPRGITVGWKKRF